MTSLLSFCLSHSCCLTHPLSCSPPHVMALSLPLLFLHFTYCISFTRCPSHSLSVSFTLAVSRCLTRSLPPAPFHFYLLFFSLSLAVSVSYSLPQPLLPYSFSLSESHLMMSLADSLTHWLTTHPLVLPLNMRWLSLTLPLLSTRSSLAFTLSSFSSL